LPVVNIAGFVDETDFGAATSEVRDGEEVAVEVRDTEDVL
jgi:hypothetical protein